MNFDRKKKYAVFSVPTGVGAQIGGYAGDASCYARKLSKTIPLIVNPNVVNAACFSGINENMLYVEGLAINELFKGNLGLLPSTNNKIGVIFDSAMSEELINVHINTVNAVKTVYGIDISTYIKTREPVGVNFSFDQSGISTGEVLNLQTLLDAGEKLKSRGIDAIAVVCLFPEPEEDSYEAGDGTDIVGGVEAMISHALTKKLKIPCVHAPAFEDITIGTKLIHPKACAEYITPTFLPCLFFGLNNAPKLTDLKNAKVTVKDVEYLIMPFNSLGTEAVFSAIENNVQVVAIKENKTVLNVTPELLGLSDKIKSFDTYDECCNYISINSQQKL